MLRTPEGWVGRRSVIRRNSGGREPTYGAAAKGSGIRFSVFDVADEHEESVRYLYTHVRAPRDGRWNLHLGADSGQVQQAWLNGTALLPEAFRGAGSGGDRGLAAGGS